MLWKSKTVRFFSPGDEENLRIAGQLPHDLGAAHKMPDAENVLAIEQHSLRHNGLHEYTSLKRNLKGPGKESKTNTTGLGCPLKRQLR